MCMWVPTYVYIHCMYAWCCVGQKRIPVPLYGVLNENCYSWAQVFKHLVSSCWCCLSRRGLTGRSATGVRLRDFKVMNHSQFTLPDSSWGVRCEFSAASAICCVPGMARSFPSGTTSPDEPFLLEIALVMMCYHSNRQVTNALWN